MSRSGSLQPCIPVKRAIPEMDHCAAPESAPRIGDGFSGSDARIQIDGKQAAHSIVVLPDEAQGIGHGGGTPSQIELGRLEARGRPGNRAAHAERADILQLHARAHRARLQVELPAARAVLLDAARNIDQCEGTFVVPLLEIDAPAVHINPRKGAPRAHRAKAPAGRQIRARASGGEAGGSQRSIFQWPSASRARFKLGRDSETEPNSKRPASKRRPSQARR